MTNENTNETVTVTISQWSEFYGTDDQNQIDSDIEQIESDISKYLNARNINVDFDYDSNSLNQIAVDSGIVNANDLQNLI